MTDHTCNPLKFVPILAQILVYKYTLSKHGKVVPPNYHLDSVNYMYVMG